MVDISEMMWYRIPIMKQKNFLKASIRINGNRVQLYCRKVKKSNTFRWYGNDGSGEVLVDDDNYSSLKEARYGLITTFPPTLYDTEASWI